MFVDNAKISRRILGFFNSRIVSILVELQNF